MKAYKHVLLTGVCMLWFCFRVMPQLCPSSALAPVFTQDFGQGTSATSTTTATAGSTNYIFGNVGTDGNYVITPSFDVSGKADWTKLGDHTGNTNGNMFLVNAGGGKSIFFKQTVTGLCSGSTFNFSAWLANANTPNTQAVCGSGLVYPKVIFNIRDLSNNILATFTTGNLPLSPNNGPANWQQYGFQFSLPNGTTSLVLEMVDYYGGAAACGNDLALDDILFTACTPQVSVSLSTASSICSGTSTTISSSLVNSPFTTPAYQWQKSTDNGVTWNNTGTPGTTAANLTLSNVSVSDGAKYRILVGPNVASLSSLTCVSASAPISLTVYPSPSVSVSASSHVCTGFPLNLFLTASGGVTPYSYTWTGPNGFTSNINNPVLPNVAITASGTYALALTDANNCTASNQVTLSVLQTPVLTITNNSALICTGTGVSIEPASSIAGSLFGWSAATLSGTASGYTANATALTNGSISDVINNTNSLPAAVNYAITTTTPDGCNASGSTTVTIQPTPTAAHAGTSQTLCAASSAVLAANTITVGTGSWTYPAATTGVSFTNPASPSTTVNGLTTGTYRFVWNASNSVCAVSTDTATITIAPQTVAGVLSSDTTVCAGVNNGTLSLSGYTGNIIQWESSTDNGGSWSVITNTGATYTFSGTTTKTLYRALVQSGNCGAQYSNIVTVNVNAATIAGTLTGDATVCSGINNGNIVLSGYTGNILQWETSTDNGSTWTSTLNNSNTVGYTNLAATTLYKAKIQNGVCGALYSNNVTVAVNAASIAGSITGSATVCATANSGTVSISGQTGNIQWETSTDNGGNWMATPVTTAAYSFINLSATTQFRAKVTNGVCVAQYSGIATVAVDPATVAGTLSADITVCAGANNGTLSMTGYTGTILQWETSTDNGSTWSATTNTGNTLSYNNIAATTQFRTLVQSGVCAATHTNVVTITVNAATVAGSISGTATVCAAANNGDIVITAPTGNILHWETSSDNGANWQVVNQTNTTYHYTQLSTTTQFRALVQSGICVAQYSGIATVTVDPATTVGLLSGNATVCATANSGSLSMTGYTGSILQWETSADNGSTWSTTLNTNNTFAYNNLATSTHFRALVQSGVCNAGYSNIATITVNAATAPGTMSGTTTVCASANSGSVSISGQTGNILQWETSTDNGNSWQVNTSTTATVNYSNLTATTQYRALVQNGVCAAAYSNIATIQVDAPTGAGSLSSNATVCANANSGALTLTGNTGNILQWETSTDNGNNWSVVSNNNNHIQYNNLTATTTYRALVQNGVCPAVYSNSNMITVNAATVAGTLSGTTIVCAASNSGTINISGYTGDIIRWETSTDNGNSWSNIANTTAQYSYNMLSSTINVRALVQSGICAAQYSNAVIVSVDPASVAGTMIGNATVCAGSNNGNITVSGFTGNITGWETSVDNGTSWLTVSNTAASTSYANLTGTTSFRVKVQNGVCPAATSNIATVAVDAATNAGSVSGTATVCAGANNGVIVLSGNNGNILQWETSADNGANWSVVSGTGNTYTYHNLTATTVVRVITQNGVCAAQSANSTIIHVDSVTVAGMLSGDTTICANTNTGIISLSGYRGNIIQWETSTDNGTSWNINSHATASYNYQNIAATTQYRVLLQNGVCAAQYAGNSIVTVKQAVTPAIAGPAQVLCQQLSATLAANNAVSGTGRWTLVTGSPVIIADSSLPNSHIAGLAAGAYRFAWTIANNVCPSSSDSVLVTVLPSISNSIDTIQQTLCYGQAFTIQGQPSTGGNGSSYQYQWERSFDNNQWTIVAGATNVNFVAQADTTMWLRRTILSSVCASTSDPVSIVVHASLMNNTITGDQHACIGSMAQVITGSLPTGGNGRYQYQWQQSLDSGNTWITVGGSTQNFSPGTIAATALYKRIISSGACTAAYSATSHIVNVIAQAPAKAELIVSVTKGCAPFAIDGSLVQLVPSANNSSYDWYINDTLKNSGAAIQGFTLYTDSASVKVKANGLYGCAADSAVVTMYVYATPTPSFNVSDTIGCGPLTVNFTNTTPDTNNYQYSWDMGNGSAISHSVTPIPVSFASSVSGADTSYTVVLKAYQHCDTVTVSKKITVSAKAKANLTAVAQSTCSPLNVIFSNLSVGSGVTYSIDYGDGSNGNVTSGSQLAHTYHTGSPTTFTAVLHASNGCGADSAAIAFATMPSPVNTDITIPDTAICGAPHNLIINNQTTSAIGYKWDFGDGSPVLNLQTQGAISHTYTAPGNYLITNTISSYCSDSVVYRKIQIHAGVTAVAARPLQDACIGTQVAFQNLSDSTLSARWNFGDGTVMNANNATHAFTRAGTYLATLTVWKTYSDITCYDSTQQSIALVDKKPGQLSLSDTSGKCLPFAVSFVNKNNPAIITKWSFGDGSTGSGDSVSHPFAANGRYMVTMEATQAGGCRLVDTGHVTVNAPTVNLSYKGGAYCTTGNSIEFTPQVDRADSIRWDFGDGSAITTTAQKTSHSYTRSGGYLPKVMVVGTDHCLIPAIAKDSIYVDEINPGFKVAAINNCAITNYQFTDTSRSFFAITARRWILNPQTASVNTGLVNVTTLTNESVVQQVYTKAGDYEAALQVQNKIGCTARLDAKFNVLVYEYPQADISAINDACLHSLMEVKSIVNSQDSVIRRLWNLGNGTAATDSVVKVQYYSDGNYLVKLTVGTVNNCYDSAFKQLSIHPLPTLTVTNKVACLGDSVELKASGATGYIWKDQYDNVLCNNCSTLKTITKKDAQFKVIGYNEYGCSDINTSTVRIIEPFKLSLLRSDSLCEGTTKKLFVNGADSYQWQPDPGLSTYSGPITYASPAATTTYKVIGKDAYQCFADTATIQLVVGKPTPVHVGGDTSVTAGVAIQLNTGNQSPDIRQWQWGGKADYSCVYCASPMVKVIDDEYLTVKATNQFGCISTDTVRIKTFCSGADVFIPNAFTPDGDGVNDILVPMGKGIKIMKSFRIFSRWGELVFERTNFSPGDRSAGWDGTVRGKKASTDVYVYLCEAVCEKGTAYTFKGNVAIIK